MAKDAPDTGTCALSEDCTNGVDDNCDQLSDCADPQCTTGYTCTEAAPAGWSAPVVRFEGPGAPPACTGQWPNGAYDGNATLAAGNAGCGGGTCCRARPPAGFESKACVLMAGDVACPSGGYSAKRLYYGGVTDTRDCAACTCDKPTGGSCDGTVVIYDQPGCN